MVSNVPRGAELMLALLRSGQLTSLQMEHLMEMNPLFARWYRATQPAAH